MEDTTTQTTPAKVPAVLDEAGARTPFGDALYTVWLTLYAPAVGDSSGLEALAWLLLGACGDPDPTMKVAIRDARKVLDRLAEEHGELGTDPR